MEKLTSEELETIQKLVQEFNTTKTQLGETVLSQNSLIKSIEELKDSYAKEEAKLIGKYGKDSIINLQTGEVTFPEEETESEDGDN